VASAGETINDAGAIACINDKWDEKEVEKGHKLVDFAGRCVHIPDAPTGFRTSHLRGRMSGIGGKADMTRTGRYVG
jgi:hypothetical protein